MAGLTYLAFALIALLQGSVHGQINKGKYYFEAFTQDGEPNVLVLKIKPVDPNFTFEILKLANKTVRQEVDDEDETPTTTPYIPQIVPGLTKIFNGIFSGNVNEIVHGGSSFAPKEVSLAVDTAYNQAVGLPAPTTSGPTTTGPVAANGTATSLEVSPSVDEDEDGTDETEEARKLRSGRVIFS